MHWNAWVTGAGGLVALILLVVGVVAVGNRTYLKAQIEALRGDRDDMKKRIDYLEAENTRHEQEGVHLRAKLTAAEEKVAILEHAIRGTDHFSVIERLLRLIATKLGVAE